MNTASCPILSSPVRGAIVGIFEMWINLLTMYASTFSMLRWQELHPLHSIVIQGIYKRMVRFQKLTRNLFLALHGHNVHSQQRQMSKFLMR